MSLSGSSRPCSGSEHLISHTLDFYKFDSSTLHGFKVGCLSLFCLFLQQKLTKEILHYSKKINLNPHYIFDVLSFFEDNLPSEDILKLFKGMRKNRYTILDQYTQQDLYRLSDDYKALLELQGI